MRPLAPPLTAALGLGLVTAGRFHDTAAFIAALAGLCLLAFYVLQPDRSVLFFALLPMAAWLAGRPTWGGVAGAVILAGTFVLVLGRPADAWGRESRVALLIGVASGVVSGIAARQAGLVGDVGDAVAIVLLLATFRLGTVMLGTRQPLYGVACSLSTLPHVGAAGLLIAAIEAVAGLASFASPASHRIAFALGAPAALVSLL